ncbi:hypothetical protein QBC40DRAFT_257787 [Triangularia verruculosa]|uniref:Uncharacterized protein n=1 Tax=Triangularia verruculosa TaxID=2587418 RepID=A0AAN6XDN6_9PEZI|nr:hypothetical protein QBC40DRAFT_257787 [Triangularia verruculosa]
MSEYKAPWPRGFGIFLEAFFLVFYFFMLSLYICAKFLPLRDPDELSTSESPFESTAQARRIQIKEASEAVVCPKLIKRVQESNEMEGRNSVSSRLGRALRARIKDLLQRYPWIRAPATKFKEVRSKHPRFFTCLVIVAGVFVLGDYLFLIINGILVGPTTFHYAFETLVLLIFAILGLALLFNTIYDRRESRRYEAKIAKEMAHHICVTEKGCVEYVKGGEELKPSEEQGEREKTEKKEDV